MYLSFDQKLILDPSSEFYVERKDHQLNRLFFDLKMSQDHMHAFLCGHRGSGKTTELLRMCKDKSINEKYHTVYLTAQEFGNETVGTGLVSFCDPKKYNIMFFWSIMYWAYTM